LGAAFDGWIFSISTLHNCKEMLDYHWFTHPHALCYSPSTIAHEPARRSYLRPIELGGG